MRFMAVRTHKDFKDQDIAKLSDTFTAFQERTLEDIKVFFLLQN